MTKKLLNNKVHYRFPLNIWNFEKKIQNKCKIYRNIQFNTIDLHINQIKICFSFSEFTLKHTRYSRYNINQPAIYYSANFVLSSCRSQFFCWFVLRIFLSFFHTLNIILHKTRRNLYAQYIYVCLLAISVEKTSIKSISCIMLVWHYLWHTKIYSQI